MLITAFNELPRIGYIHIPKCGGKSVAESFHRINTDDMQLSMDTTKHWTYMQYKNTPKGYARYGEPDFWFTTVRHPASRWLSWYYYTMHGDKISEKTAPFYKQRLALFEKYGPNETIMCNKELVAELNDIGILKETYRAPKILMFDYIRGAKNLHIFDIEQHSEKMFLWLNQKGFPIEPIHTNKNKSNSKPWQDILSEKTRKYLFQKQAVDYDYFGYKP